MFKFLDQVNNVVQQTLKVSVRRLQPLQVDQQLADLEFLKDGYTAIVHKPKASNIHTWAEYGQHPQDVAKRLIDQLDRVMIDMDKDKVILYVSPVFMDYQKGQLYSKGVTVMLQFVVYQYVDGVFTTYERGNDWMGFSQIDLQHTLCEFGTHKVRVHPQNIERYYEPRTISLADYKAQVIEEYETSVGVGLGVINKTFYVLDYQERIQALLDAGAFSTVIVLLQEILQAEVKHVGYTDAGPLFLYEEEEHSARYMLNQVRKLAELPRLMDEEEEIAE